MNKTPQNPSTTAESTTTKPAGPLAGIRVIDLGRVIAAPYASQMLADYGAEVIKIERPGVGDDSRSMTAGCLLDDDGNKILTDTSMFLIGNRSKRSVTVDLGKPEGQQILHRLAAVSDVLVENFVPGTVKRWNIDYETLAAINPRLIYVSVSGWGQTGPYSLRPGYDAALQAATGFMSVTGQPDGTPGAGPVRLGSSVIDFAAGMNAAFAIMVALRHRDATGEGQYIDVALYDTGIAIQAENVQKFLMNGDLVGRHGTSNYGGAPARHFAASDGDVFFMGANAGQFTAICDVLGCPELDRDPRFATSPLRFVHRDALFPVLEPLIAKWKAADLVDALSKAHVPASVVNNYQQVFDDPHTAARGVEVKLDHPKSKRLKLIASPMKFSRTPAQYRRPPMIGEHTDDVLQELLDMTPGDIAALRAKGAL